jgi:hypothetical protein
MISLLALFILFIYFLMINNITMKYLKSFRLFENLDSPLSIEQFITQIGIPQQKRERIISWWNENRSDIQIHYFTFSSPNPILGVFLSTTDVAINQRVAAPPHIKLFLALHESRHCDQHAQGILMPGYWDTVVAGDKTSFLEAYRELEHDANSFALQAMRAMGFTTEMDREETRLRGNEEVGEMIWSMMRADVQRFRPDDFIDLLKMQVL